MLRFCAELINANVLTAESFTDIIGKIIEQSDPEQNGKMAENGAASVSACSARSELFLYVIIDILPFIGKTLFQKDREFLCNAMSQLQRIFRSRTEVMPTEARKMLSVFNQVRSMRSYV